MRFHLISTVGPILLLAITSSSQVSAAAVDTASTVASTNSGLQQSADTTNKKYVGTVAQEAQLEAVASTTMMMGDELVEAENIADEDDDEEGEDEDEDDEDEDYDDEDEDYDDEDEDYEDEDEDYEDEDEDYDDEDDDGQYDEEGDEDQDQDFASEDAEGACASIAPTCSIDDEPTSTDNHAISVVNPSSTEKKDDAKLNNIRLRKRREAADSSIMAGQEGEEGYLSAQATAEPGGACIDSFVNFALRFRDRCTISCLKTMTHIFVNPNVLGLLDCFGCSNFLVAGFYALGVDCIGLFSSPVKVIPPTTSIAPALPTAVSGKALMDSDQSVIGDESSSSSSSPREEIAGVHPADSGLPSIDIGSVIGNLVKVNATDIQDWLDIGAGVVKLVDATNKKAAAEKEMNEAATSPVTPPGSFTMEGAADVEGAGQVKAQRDEDEEQESDAVMPMNKKTFNSYILKAAQFANWKLTPKMLDDSGAYDRAQAAGLV
ncbi:hypothetical protein BGZ83_003126 [Gryganskiella cystojenkinii]|nr:hypothetical protein BGZ83_003126 [Gryganskiella cystojenkinii]